MYRGLIQSKSFLLGSIVVATIIGAFLYPTTDVKAVNDCCLQKKQIWKTEYKENGTIYDTEVDGTRKYISSFGPEKKGGCTARASGASCAPDSYGSDFNCSTTNDVDEDNADLVSCQVEKISEEAVNCTAYAECLTALKSLSNCTNLSPTSCRQANGCFWDGVACKNKYDNSICSSLKTSELCGGANGSQACQWNSTLRACITKTEAGLSNNRTNRSDILPDCAVTGTCRSLNDLVETAIKIARKLFGLFGTFALAMFIYGGVCMIASFGNPEQFQKGKSILSAAIIGIIIAFGAFMLIGYVLSALGVDQELRAGVTVVEPQAAPRTP